MFKLNLPALFTLAATLALPAAATEVAYPKDFRQWQHVSSLLIKPGHPLYDAVGGLHHIYGNRTAIKGYRAGKFADGSMIAFDLFTAVDQDNAVGAGERKAVLVMVRDRKAFRSTDGWGYQVFDPQTGKASLDAKAQADCHACHTAQKARDFVFSTLRD